MGIQMSRPDLTTCEVNRAIDDFIKKMFMRLEQKGYGALVSSHEILGILDEEYFEYRETVQKNSPPQDKIEELLDIAVGAVFGAASIQTGKVDW